MRRYRAALLVAFTLAAFFIGVRVASAEGDYNDNPSYCQGASMLDPFYYYYRCWLPAPPDWGRAE